MLVYGASTACAIAPETRFEVIKKGKKEVSPEECCVDLHLKHGSSGRILGNKHVRSFTTDGAHRPAASS